MINQFLSERYSEELFSVSETEHDEVMQMIAAESEGFEGYGEWSAALESENFVVVNGQLRHKAEPKSNGRLKGIEI